MRILGLPKPDEVDDDFWIALSAFVDKTINLYNWYLDWDSKLMEFGLFRRSSQDYTPGVLWIRYLPIPNTKIIWANFPIGTIYTGHHFVHGNILTSDTDF